MRTRVSLFAVILTTLVSWACVNGSATPTGPSAINLNSTLLAGPAVLAAQFPSLTGRWRASGKAAFRNLETGNTLNWSNCSGSLNVTTQDDQRFSGTLGTQGSGWNNDRFCTASGTFVGELLAGDGSAARVWLDGESRNWPRPSVSPSCEFVSTGDGIWTGSATSDGMSLQVSDTLRCPVNVEGGPQGIAMANFERTVTLVFQR